VSDAPPTMVRATTASGARVMVVVPDLAEPFVDRFGLGDYQPLAKDLAWGAFEDGRLIGVAIMSRLSVKRGRLWLVVTPERRRLGVGKELAWVLAAAAQELNLHYVHFRTRTDDEAPRRLAASLGQPLGRRVDADMVSTVICMPGCRADRL